MSTTSSPTWAAGKAELVGNADAIAMTGRVNQELSTHAADVIYQGVKILTPFGGNFNQPYFHSYHALEFAQPFTMSGTTIGRVVIPVAPVGDGADLIVSLCADNSGTPGAVITQTRVPASWITQLSAIVGTVASTPSATTFQYTNSPLASAQFNAIRTAATTIVNWPYPTTGTGLSVSSMVACSNSNYIIVMGGSVASTALSGVYTVGYDTAGDLNQAVPQQSLPSPQDGTGAATVVVDPSSSACTLVISGGATTFNGAATNIVYTAEFNPATGTIASWSTQTVLPFTTNNHVMASYNGYVYVTGGSISTSVTYAQVSNGQITTWLNGPPLPALLPQAYMAAVDGFLFVIGGYISMPLSNVYYAPINSDGSLGAWIAGPTLPNGAFAAQGATAVLADDLGIVVNNNGQLYMLGVGPNGPDIVWTGFNTAIVGRCMGAVNSSPGLWRYCGLNETNYATFELFLLPNISVPLPASGLTNGGTYHVVTATVTNDPNNDLLSVLDSNVFPGNPTNLSQLKTVVNAWVPNNPGFGSPMTIYDDSGVGQPWHTWEDNGARVTTLVYATTPDKRLIGLCEATEITTALNSNTGFESGSVSPWVIGTASAFTASTTQAYEGKYSGHVVPNGTSTVAYTGSEQLPCMPGQSVMAFCRVYSTTGIAAPYAFSMSVNWYDASQIYISTSSNTVTIPSAVWTPVVNTFTAPSTAYFAQLAPTESGTPPVGHDFYYDTCFLSIPGTAPQQSTVTEVEWSGTWPNPDWPANGAWPPRGITELA